MGKSLKAKSYLSFLLCCNNFLLPFLESLLCITVMYYNIKTVITISLLYVKYKYMYQDLLLFLNDNDRQLHHIQWAHSPQIKHYRVWRCLITKDYWFSITRCIQIKPTFSDEFLQEKLHFPTGADSNSF